MLGPIKAGPFGWPRKTRPALTGPAHSGWENWRSGRENARGAGRTKELLAAIAISKRWVSDKIRLSLTVGSAPRSRGTHLPAFPLPLCQADERPVLPDRANWPSSHSAHAHRRRSPPYHGSKVSWQKVTQRVAKLGHLFVQPAAHADNIEWTNHLASLWRQR